MADRKGELRVQVISAQGLRDTAVFGIQDPYAQLEVGSVKVRTAVHRDGGTSPIWNESIKLSISHDAPSKLLVKIKSSSALRDHLLGSTEVDLSDVFTCHHEQVSAPLYSRDGRQRGEVHLSMSFQPAKITPSPPPVPDLAAVQPQHTPASDRLATNSTATSTVGSSSDSRKDFPDGAQQLPNATPGYALSSDEHDLGPLGKSLMALSMSHITPSGVDPANSSKSVETQQLLSVNARPLALPTATAAPIPAVPSTAQAVAPAQLAAPTSTASPKRNYYPELVVDNGDPHSWAMMHQSAQSQAGVRSEVQPTSDSPVEALQQNGDVGSESYSAAEIYGHQYGMPQQQHTASMHAMQQGHVHYHGHGHYSQSFLAGQHGTNLAVESHGSQAGQGSLEQGHVPRFHLLGTTPLHDGQFHQGHQEQSQQMQQGSHDHKHPHMHMQHAQHLVQQQPKQMQQHSNALDYTHSHEHMQHAQQQTQHAERPPQHAQRPPQHTQHALHPMQHVQQQGDPPAAIPAWRLMGTSPLQHGNTGNSVLADEQHFSNAVQPLSYAGMAVQSWSAQVKRMPSAYRTSHDHDLQGDLSVAFSAPSAPGVHRFVQESGHSITNKQTGTQLAHMLIARPEVSVFAAPVTMPYGPSGLGTQTPLHRTGRDRNAVV